MEIRRPFVRLDLKENVEFTFSDPEWVVKMLKLCLSYILFFTIPAVMGYQLAVIREAADGEDEKLPEFGSNFGSLWMKGLVFGFMLCVVVMIPIMGFGAIGVGAAMALDGGGNEGVAAVLGVSGLLLFLLFCFVIGILIPALMLRYAMTGSVSSLFDIRAAFSDIKQGPSDYAVIVIVPILGQFLAGLVSATGIGMVLVIPLTVLIMIVQARMLGNYYRAYFH
jgi:Protein of unknown function (DUF4013)